MQADNGEQDAINGMQEKIRKQRAEIEAGNILLRNFKQALSFAAMRLGYPSPQALLDAANAKAPKASLAQQLRYWAVDAHLEGQAMIPVEQLRTMAAEAEQLVARAESKVP